MGIIDNKEQQQQQKPPDSANYQLLSVLQICSHRSIVST